ncbi:hypothetical protein [Candidatus Protofrankia californiensis]|uniref:hypothetical protein n=1 Tax=Candidatus Protofrankia californiensis TaxID=1839754 RepID=UPI0019CFED06|nr:hypothetical protein [Candidatus Protofrankia californiensis]
MPAKTNDHVRDEEREEAKSAKERRDGTDERDEDGTTAEHREESQAGQAGKATGNGRVHGEAEGEQESAGEERGPHTATLRTPFATARVEIPRAPGTSMKVGPIRLPSPAQTAFYVGLGVLAVTEVVEWPIAAAIGAGTYVAQRSRAGASAARTKSQQSATT